VINYQLGRKTRLEPLEVVLNNQDSDFAISKKSKMKEIILLLKQ
jgi:hypothetical protein